MGTIEEFFRALKFTDIEKTPYNGPSFHPRRSTTLTHQGTVLGWVGELHPDVSSALDCKEPLVGAEIDIAALIQVAPQTVTLKPLSAFPSVLRDISMVIAEDMPYATVLKTLRLAAGSMLESCDLIDLYRGASIGADKKSLTLSLLFRHRERTLKDAEVESTMNRIKSELEKRCEAKIRQ